MKITRLFVLALMVVSAGVFTSCKDYEQDNTNAIIAQQQSIQDALQAQINGLKTQLAALKQCQCSDVATKAYVDGEISRVEGMIGDMQQLVLTSSTAPASDIVKAILALDVEIKKIQTLLGTGVIKDDKGNTVADITTALNDIYVKLGAITGCTCTPGTGCTCTPTPGCNCGSTPGCTCDPSQKCQCPSDVVARLAALEAFMGTSDNENVKTTIQNLITEALGAQGSITNAITSATSTLATQSTVNGIQTTVNGMQTTVSGMNISLQAVQTVLGDDNEGLVKLVNDLSSRITDLETEVEAIKNTLAKLVTGIITQGVSNPYYGSVSTPFGIESNLLVAFYGEASKSIYFPSVDECLYACKANSTLISDAENNAGTVYMTVNPSDVDFEGLKVSLANSQDVPCAIKLGELKKSDRTLKFGLGRAADNGFYEAPAHLDAADIESASHIYVDKSAVKTALSNLVHSNRQTIKSSLKEVGSVIVETAAKQNIDAQGLKCTYSDGYNKLHNTYSNYDIAALAVKPLGFNTADAIFADGGAYWKMYGKGKKFIERQYKRLANSLINNFDKQFKLNKLNADLKDVQSKIHRIDLIDVDKYNFTVQQVIDTTLVLYIKADATVDPQINWNNALDQMYIYTEFEYDEVNHVIKGVESSKKLIKYLKDEGAITVTASPVVNIYTQTTKPTDLSGWKMIEIAFHKEFKINLKDRIAPMIEEINAGFSDTNQLLDAMEILLKDAQDMLDQINKLEEKIKSGDVIFDRLYKYADRAANAIGKYTPKLFKPALLINSDNGFGLAGSVGSPSVVKGSVTVYPTTFSAGLVAPVFKKAIKVDGGAYQLVEGRSYTLGNLSAGTHTIVYSALDYYGNQIDETYVIWVK